jgi:enhancing lycopene biosynthesis protein 2
VGTPDEPSPYDIAAISAGIEQVGARAHFNSVREITVDASNHIISAPCYMMDATITEVRENVAMAMDALAAMLSAE